MRLCDRGQREKRLVGLGKSLECIKPFPVLSSRSSIWFWLCGWTLDLKIAVFLPAWGREKDVSQIYWLTYKLYISFLYGHISWRRCSMDKVVKAAVPLLMHINLGIYRFICKHICSGAAFRGIHAPSQTFMYTKVLCTNIPRKASQN